MYVCAAVIGVAFSFSTMIPISMMVINWFVKKRGLAMSITMTGIGIGGFVFSPLVTFFLEQYGWRLTYRIMAVIVFAVSFPVAAFILRARPEDSGLKPYGADDAEQGVTNKGAAHMLPTGITLTVKESYSKMFFWLLLMGMFFCGILNTGSLGQFPPAIQGMHGAVVQATIISLYSFFGIFAKLVLGWLNDRFGMVVSTLVGGAAFMLTFVLMLFGENLTLLYIMAFFFGFGISVPAVLPPLLVSSIFGSKNYGEVYGLTTSTMNLGSAMGSLIVAQIFDRTGSYSMGWLLLMVVVALTVICWMTSYSGSKQYFAENNMPA